MQSNKRPELFVNPDDPMFGASVLALLEGGATTAEELQHSLRERFPRAVVRRRDLDGESADVWYVYREGRWIRASHVGEGAVTGRTGHDLRATSDDVLASLDQLVVLESTKRFLAPDDPQVVELSAEIEDLTANLMRQVSIEHELSRQAHEHELSRQAQVELDAGAPQAPDRPIEETPPRAAHQILDEWRAAERRAKDEPPGFSDAGMAALDVNRLRHEYHRAWEAARRKDGK